MVSLGRNLNKSAEDSERLMKGFNAAARSMEGLTGGELQAAAESLATSLGTTAVASMDTTKELAAQVKFMGLSADEANDLEKYSAAIQKMSLVEGAWDKIKELVSFGNLGVKADFGENVSKGIIAQIKLIPEGPAKEELKEKLKKIFQVGNLTETGLEKRLQGESTFTVDKLAKQAQATLAPVVNTIVAQNDKVQGFKSSLDAANKAGQNLVNIDYYLIHLKAMVYMVNIH
jgi:hypothetical protein